MLFLKLLETTQTVVSMPMDLNCDKLLTLTTVERRLSVYHQDKTSSGYSNNTDNRSKYIFHHKLFIFFLFLLCFGKTYSVFF